MTREILFRGKILETEFENIPHGWSEKDGDWVEGHYHIRVDCTCNRYEGCECDGFEQHLVTNGKGQYPVDPATLGEFTGLPDRNGNKIFEGDILHVNSWRKFKVIFCEALFGVKDFNETGDTYDYTLRNILENWDGVEIIGNIHDNPELVGGAK